MPSRNGWFPVPNDEMDAAVDAVQKETGVGADSWTTKERRRCRELLGPKWSHLDEDSIGVRAGQRRKNSKSKIDLMRGRNGKGQPLAASRNLSPEYLAYLESPKWKDKAAEVIGFWKSCCLCCSSTNLQVHHRTYDRLYDEIFTDLVLLCRKCHKMADLRRQRTASKSG